MSQKRQWSSPQARLIMAQSNVDATQLQTQLQMAQAAEDVHLEARGRVCGTDGRVNGPDDIIEDVRMIRWNKQHRVLTVRAEDYRLPDFWLADRSSHAKSARIHLTPERLENAEEKARQICKRRAKTANRHIHSPCHQIHMKKKKIIFLQK